MNFSIIVVPYLMLNDEVVSSAAIREALADGDMQRAFNMLGRGVDLGLSKKLLQVGKQVESSK